MDRKCSNCSHYYKSHQFPYKPLPDDGFICYPREGHEEACWQWMMLLPDNIDEDNLCKICLDLEAFLDGMQLTDEDRATANSIQARLKCKLRGLGLVSYGIKSCQN